MKRPNRINVAASRAMDRLVIVGAKRGWAAGEPMAELVKNFDVEVAAGNAILIEASNLLEGQRAAQEASASSAKVKRDIKVGS
jgi:alcohol dehydrogenase YqhD (iron-dependent ADH family)